MIDLIRDAITCCVEAAILVKLRYLIKSCLKTRKSKY